MSTVGELIDRVKRDWLEAADNQPTRFTLDGSITAGSTSLVYDDTLLSPEEIDLLGPGTLIEIESEEIILGGDVDEDNNTVSLAIRGANGTSAATHTDGAEAVVAPVWRRRVIFDAIADAVEQLYPSLYRISTTPLTASITGYNEIGASIGEPLYFWGAYSGTTSYDRYPVTFLDHFPAVTSGKAVTVQGIASGASGYLVYKAPFERPADEDDDLITYTGLEPQWEQIVIVSAVAYLVAGRELEQVDQERLTKQLERQGFPALTATRIRQSLLQYRDQLMARAVDALRAREPTSIQYTSGL